MFKKIAAVGFFVLIAAGSALAKPELGKDNGKKP
jgi:hypothetical protein